jgi:YD repeat-containing protein
VVSYQGSSYVNVIGETASAFANPTTVTSGEPAHWTLLALKGSDGATGSAGRGFTYRGAWTANTAYATYDVLTYGGAVYTPTAAFTSGSTFSASSLSVMVPAAGGVTDPPKQVITYNTDGTQNTVTSYDASNTVIRTATYAYSSGNLATVSTVTGSTTVVRTYTYDAAGNVTGYTEA